MSKDKSNMLCLGYAYEGSQACIDKSGLIIVCLLVLTQWSLIFPHHGAQTQQ